jgi:flagellar basal body-associated protein FliL
MSSKKEKAPADGAEGAKGGKKLPLVPILAAAVVLVGGGTFVFGQKVGAKSAPVTVIKEENLPGVRMKLEEMIVNLKGEDQFIKATPEVEFKKVAEGGGGHGEGGPEKEFEPFVSRIEGAITLVLRETTVEELSSNKGVEAVERKMVHEINEAIEEKEGKVKGVVIGKFATQ